MRSCEDAVAGVWIARLYFVVLFGFVSVFASLPVVVGQAAMEDSEGQKFNAMGRNLAQPGRTGPSTTIDPARQAAWEAAQAQARSRIDQFDAAVRSGNPESVRKAALDLQTDPIAIQKMNQNRPDLVTAHNNVTDNIKTGAKTRIQENMAKQWNAANPDKPPIKPEDVKIYEPTNYKDPDARPKSGQDWDVTVQIKQPDGTFKDVPPSQSKNVVEKSYYDAAGGEKTFGKGSTPEQVAHKQSVETTSGKSPEAYKDPDKILGTSGQKPDPSSKLSDPGQLTQAIEHKSTIAGNKADAARAAGNQVDAVHQDFEQMRQASKQYDKITKGRVEAAGGKVNPKVEEGMNIIRDAGSGKISPEEARAKLAGMGETPDSIINKAAGQAEAAQKLQKKPVVDGPDSRKPTVADGPDGKPLDAPEVKGGKMSQPEGFETAKTGKSSGLDAPDSKMKPEVPDAPDAKTGQAGIDSPDSKGLKPIEPAIPGSPKTGKTTPGATVDAPDAPKVTVDSPDVPGGKTPGAKVEVPDGPKVSMDTPDAPGSKSTKIGSGSGFKGKVIKGIGVGMDAVDIFGTAEDVKNDLQKGDFKGAATKTGEAVANQFTAGAYSTIKDTSGKLSDKSSAQSDIDKANKTNEDAYDLQSAKKLREAGVSREEVKKIMDAKARGDESALSNKFKEMGVKPPEKIVEKGPAADDTASERATAVAQGMADNAKKAGKFLNDARKDLTEIGVGLTEKGVASEVAGQVKENASDMYGTYKDNKKADQTLGDGKQSMVDRLIAKGATPEGAQKAADALYDKGDTSSYKKLSDLLNKKNSGRDSARKESQGLKGNEADMPDQPEGAAAKAGETAGGIGSFIKDKTSKADSNNKSSYQGMKSQADLSKASTSGDTQVDEAKNLKNKAGSESQKTTNDSATQTASADKKGSMGSTLADAMAKGFAAGGAAMGSAAAGAATGGKGMGDVFGGASATGSSSEKGSSSETGSKGADGGSKMGNAPDPSDGPEESGSSAGAESTGGASSTVSTSAKRSPAVSKPKVPKKITKKCNECGYSMTISAGESFPGSCPGCGAGPGKVRVSCSKCSYVYTGPESGAPKVCPRCPKVPVPSKKK